MPIPLEDSTPIPSVKVPNVGDEVIFAIVKVDVVPWTDFTSGEVKVGKDGKQRTQDRIRAIVISGNASTGKKGDYQPIHPGQEVNVFLAGHHRWEYVQAKKAHGVLNVGDVARWKFERTEPSQGGGGDKHVTSVAIRSPKAEEAKYVTQAEELYMQLKAMPLEPAMVGGNNGFDDDEAPF